MTRTRPQFSVSSLSRNDDAPVGATVGNARRPSGGVPGSVDPHERRTMSVATSVEAPSDAELISAVRGGDLDAYGTLFERHVDAARRLARQLAPAGDAEDLVSEAFVKVMGVLQRGGGPDLAFRAYLLTSVRRLQVDRFRAGSPAAHDRRHGGVRPGGPVPRHGGRGLRERGRGPRLRQPPGALAARAVAHRGGGRQARRHRAAARDERQLGLGARLPRPRGTSPGVPHPARRRARGRHAAAGPTPSSAPTSATPARAATPPRSSTTSTPAARAWRSTSS